jgi:hypothetical protein
MLGVFSTQHAYNIIGTIISSSSSSGWALWKSFILELSETYGSVVVFVELLKDLVGFFVSDEVASGLENSLQLTGADGSGSVHVKGVESLISVESWSGSKSLSCELSSIFNSDDGSPHAGELISSSW